MNKRHMLFRATGPILASAVAIAASTAAPARAEYRCAMPQTQEDQRACEMVRQDAPDALRLFVERTKSVYGLYFYDYVTDADLDRWSDVAHRGEESPSRQAAAAGRIASEEAPAR